MLNLDNLFPKSSIEQQYIIRAPFYTEEKINPVSAEERHRRAMFEIGNTRIGKDGRTYVSIDQNGEYQSCFVSQYSKIIENNIEPKVKNVCIELHNRNYLTFGSCQGHKDSRIRWVGLVFNNKEQKKNFIENVDSFGLKVFWYDNHIDSVERPRKKEPWYADGIRLHIVWDQPYLEGASIDEKREFSYTDNHLTKFWNVQMCRKYEHYETVIMCIGRKIVAENWFEQLKSYINYNEKEIDSITQQLEEKIKLLPLYHG